MGAFQGRALKLETACKVTFPLKCHVFLEKSFFHLKNAFCHQAASALLLTDLLKQELLEKPEHHTRALSRRIEARKKSGQQALAQGLLLILRAFLHLFRRGKNSTASSSRRLLCVGIARRAAQPVSLGRGYPFPPKIFGFGGDHPHRADTAHAISAPRIWYFFLEKEPKRKRKYNH